MVKYTKDNILGIIFQADYQYKIISINDKGYFQFKNINEHDTFIHGTNNNYHVDDEFNRYIKKGTWQIISQLNTIYELW